MFFIPRFALAAIIAVAGFSAHPAQAALTTFATFTGTEAHLGIGFLNSAANSVSVTIGSTIHSTIHAAGSKLLSDAFDEATIAGQTNASSVAYNGATGSGATILFTSDRLAFAPNSYDDVSISLAPRSPLLFARSRAARRADGTGSFSSEPAPVINAIPQPSTWAMLVMGFGFIGFQTRRRRTAGTPVTA